MKLTERRMRVLLKIQESPWRLFENDRDAAPLAGAGLIVATERWSNGTVLFCITTSGRKLLRKAILKRLEDGRDHLLTRAECISARGLKKAGLVEYLGLNQYRITLAGRELLAKGKDGMKLTEHQIRVLGYLARRKEHDWPPSGPEISKALGRPSYWAAGKLASLEKSGLVERLGATSSGGNCYRITPAGRDALDKERG